MFGPDFDQIWILSTFSKYSQYQIPRQFVQWGRVDSRINDRHASNDDFYTCNIATLRVMEHWKDRGSIYVTSKEEKCLI